ncbi:MAG: DUF1287 domain-containing protein [Hyphomonadaceae bacterium]|nr:DUF1287 domain-containing protein [Hyphomonadaceae bacterium]
MEITRRTTLASLFSVPLLPSAAPGSDTKAANLIVQARKQIGVTTLYDGAYVALDYPNGDVPRDRGVCIDVIIRAYREAFEFDFQKHVHEDMVANFSAYPARWGLTRTDRNIDHRRVPNVETWLRRRGHELPAGDWQPGDLMTCRVGGSLPHIGILSSRKDRRGRWKAIHNIGLGTLEDSRIWDYGDKRRFRFLPS